jgi:alpha-amylase
MKKLLLMLIAFVTLNYVVKAQNDAMMQAFYWNLPVDETNLNGNWWDNLASKADELKAAGITGIWIPAPSKGNWGIVDMGYGIYDHYDLGNYYQKGTTETRFGSRQELEDMIAAMHNTAGGKPKINVYADAVLNHVYSSDENEEVNPAVKGYVFDEAYRSGTQYTPYPTNEIKWVIPNAGTGDYYIKIKGYYLDYGASYKARAYDCEIDWTGVGFSGSYGWESEPNNGGGQTDNFGVSGSTMRGFIGYQGDIDEYKVTVTSTHDIVLKLTSRSQGDDGSWNWADQTNGYYPFEIWHNGQNLAPTVLQARTNTHITYVNHTGIGEANYVWNYDDFHPVDGNDYLTDWNWGGSDAIIPNTKGFGNDFNTYSSTVQTRLENWGYWMADEVGFDGFRLDFVRGFQVGFISDWINNLPLLDGSQRFIVGEYWGADYRIKNWVNDLAANGADADGFDFPLKSSLTGLCNGDAGFDMRWLNHAGMVRNNSGNALPGTSVVTWLDNHDTGKEHDKWVTKDWHLGYAYILTHEGRPCIFYPHYYGVTLVDNHDTNITVSVPSSLQEDINKLLFVRKTYLGGGLQVLSEVGNPWPSGDAYNVYVARRQGNGTKDGAIVVINNSNSTKGLWVDATPSGYSNWSNSTLKNAFTGTTTSVYGDGRVWVEAPARSYAVYVQSGDYEQYSSLKSSLVTDVKNELEPLKAVELSAYPNPVTNSTKISFATMQKGQVSVMIYDHTGKNVKVIYDGVRASGNHEFTWTPEGLANGLYFAQIKADGQMRTLKLVLNK